MREAEEAAAHFSSKFQCIPGFGNFTTAAPLIQRRRMRVTPQLRLGNEQPPRGQRSYKGDWPKGGRWHKSLVSTS